MARLWGFLRFGMALLEVIPGEVLVGCAPLVFSEDPDDDELREAIKGDDFGEAFLGPADFETSFLANTGGDEFLRNLCE